MTNKQAMVNAALTALNQNKIRCSYLALAEFVGVKPQGVSTFLGDHRPEASWVVSLKNKLPTNYDRADWHPELRSNRRMIYSGEDLEKLIEDTDKE